MPLVPQSTISSWYQKDSWVYKNFTYLFKNSLWDTKVPKGFSLCPYFWLAIFSMTFFRAFVVAVHTIRFIFKPFGGLLERTDRLCVRLGYSGLDLLGIPTLACTLLVGACLFVAGMLCVGGYQMIVAYAGAKALVSLFAPLVLAITLIVTATYKSRNKSNCKVEVYPRLIALIAIAVSYYFMPVEFITVALFTKGVVLSVLVWIWGFVTHMIPTAFVWCIKGIWSGITYMFTALIGWTVAGLGGLATVGIISWLVDKFYLDTFDYKAHKVQREQFAFLMKRFAGVCGYKARWDSDFNYSVKDDFWEWFVWEVPEIVALAEKFSKLPEDEMYRATDTTEIRDRVGKAGLSSYVIYHKQKEANAKIREEKCNKVTNTIAVPFVKIGRGVSWFFKQIWTFICLLWELAKAKKSGACPYLMFTDPDKGTNKPVKSDATVVFGGTQKLIGKQ